MKVLILLAILPIITKCLDTKHPDQGDTSIECGKDIKCILKQMQFEIPDTKISLNGSTIYISDMVLYGIDIKYLNFSYYPDENKIGDSIMLKLQIMGANFNGSIKAPKLLILKTKAHASLTNLTIELPLEFIKGSDKLMENVTIIRDAFYSHLNYMNVTAKGGSALIFKPFIPLLTKTVSNLINNNTQLYSLLNPIVEKYGSELFEKINVYLRSEVNSPEEIEIPIKNPKTLMPIIKSPIIDFLRFALNDLVADPSNPLNFNNLIYRFMGTDPGLKLTSLGKEFGFAVPIIISGDIPNSSTTIDFAIKEISIDGFDTWKDLSFLNPDPSSPYILDTHTELGNLRINISTTINFTSIDLNTTEESHYSQDLDLYVELVDNTLDFDIQIAAPEGAGSNYTSAQLLDFGCIASLLNQKETGITKLLLNTTFQRFDYDTKGVLDGFIFDTISFILDFFITNNLDLVPKFLNGFIYELLLQTALKNQIQTDTSTCPNLKDPPYSDIDLTATGACFGSAFLIGLLFLIVVIVMTKKMRKRKEKSAKLDEATNAVTIKEPSKWHQFWRTDDEASLMMHPAIPFWLRLIIPFLIFGNIALFISSNTGLGASVFLKLVISKSRTIAMPSMFDFGLINSVTEMWHSKSYFLSVLIFVLSCLWPYTKLAIMIIVWILPAQILKVHIRSRILRVLDEMGKWSLLDSYVMILMLIAFHISLSFPIVNTRDIHEPIFLHVWVFPAYGFITLIIGTLLSLALSHIICAINRKAKRWNKEVKVSTARKAVFKTQHWALNVLLVFLLVLALCAFTFGIFIKSSSFDFVGLAGWFIDLLDKPTISAYSVIDLGIGIPDCAEFPNSFAVRLTQIVFFLVTIIIPYIHMFALFFLLFLPMTKKRLLSFYYTCETLYAWSCLDVFIISILAAVLEIGQFAFFLVADKCDPIEPIIKQYFSQENYVKGHEKCFEVITRVLPGSYFLVGAAVCHTIVTIWINIKARKLSRDEEETSNENLNEGETNLNDADEEHEMDDIESVSPYVNNIDLGDNNNNNNNTSSKVTKSLPKIRDSLNSSKYSLSNYDIMNDLVKDSSVNVVSDVAEPKSEPTEHDESHTGSQTKIDDSADEKESD